MAKTRKNLKEEQETNRSMSTLKRFSRITFTYIVPYIAIIISIFALYVAKLGSSPERKGYLNSIRPELSLSGWGYEYNAFRSAMRIKTLSNVGPGDASAIYIFLGPLNEDKKKGIPSSYLVNQSGIAFLESGSTIDVNCEGYIHDVNSRFLEFHDLRIFYSDIDGNRYKTTYHLMVLGSDSPFIVGSEELAPGLFLHSRSTDFVVR